MWRSPEIANWFYTAGDNHLALQTAAIMPTYFQSSIFRVRFWSSVFNIILVLVHRSIPSWVEMLNVIICAVKLTQVLSFQSLVFSLQASVFGPSHRSSVFNASDLSLQSPAFDLWTPIFQSNRLYHFTESCASFASLHINEQAYYSYHDFIGLIFSLQPIPLTRPSESTTAWAQTLG